MDLAALTAATTTAQATPRTRVRSDVELAGAAFQKADKRVQQQQEAVSVQLSSFGKLKSSFSETQSAARALSDTRQTTTDAGIRKAAGNFVKAFNAAAQTARAATASRGALADNSRARVAENDLVRSISADANAASDLRKIGITQQRDGSLAIDVKKFDAALKTDPEALRSTLANAGQRVDRTAGRELADRGNIGSSVNALDNRARSLERQQAEQQALAVAAQQTVAAQNPRPDSGQNTGAAAYERIFSI